MKRKKYGKFPVPGVFYSNQPPVYLVNVWHPYNPGVAVSICKDAATAEAVSISCMDLIQEDVRAIVEEDLVAKVKLLKGDVPSVPFSCSASFKKKLTETVKLLVAGGYDTGFIVITENRMCELG